MYAVSFSYCRRIYIKNKVAYFSKSQLLEAVACCKRQDTFWERRMYISLFPLVPLNVLNMAFETLSILVAHLRRMPLQVPAISQPAELLYVHYKPNAHCFSYDVITVHVL